MGKAKYWISQRYETSVYIYIYIYINMNNNFLFKYICRMLVKHHEKLFNGRNKCKIFFPLCGKCVDMFW